jgi:hypothetical protein
MLQTNWYQAETVPAWYSTTFVRSTDYFGIPVSFTVALVPPRLPKPDPEV